MKRIFGLTLLVLLFVTVASYTNITSSKASAAAAPSTHAAAFKVARNDVSKGRLTRDNFEDSLRTLYHSIGLEKAGLKYDVFRFGMIGYYSLRQQGKLSQRDIVSFIDFSKPSTEKRFYTVDLKKKSLKFHSLVSHGKNTGQNMATAFSNTVHSNQSSLGFYLTGETYVGSKGYSLRLDGLDGSYNDKMRERAVVMHEANYVSESWIRKYGRLGRSQGCPALPKEISRKVIDTIKDKTLIFAYFDDSEYLANSTHLNIDNLFDRLDVFEAVTAEL
jgi:hypothetical protein